MKRSPIRTLAAVACAVALATTAAACGSSGAAPLTAKQWKSQADKICKDTSTELDKIGVKLQQLPATATKDDANKILDEGADLTLDEAKKIEKLEPPKSIAKDVKAMLAAVKDGANKIKDEGFDLLQTGQNPLADATEKAKALGLKQCGSN